MIREPKSKDANFSTCLRLIELGLCGLPAYALLAYVVTRINWDHLRSVREPAAG